MRMLILGGTRFIGAATLEDLVDHGHDVIVAHRGGTERDDLPDVPHAHLDRHDVAALREAIVEAGAEVVIDTCAYTRRDAETIIAALPEGVRHVVLSSCDTYRQFHRLHAQLPPLDPVPLDEGAPTRTGEERYLFRGQPQPEGVGAFDMDAYENLDVEELVLPRGATVLRLPMVYGERDPMRREEFVLRHVRAGADTVPIGAGTWICTRGWVRDIARAIRLAAESGVADGQALNLGERRTWPVITWAQQILEAAGSDARLEVVPDRELDPELAWAGAVSQHVLIDSARARRLLAWEDTDPTTALMASVRWHLNHPPGG